MDPAWRELAWREASDAAWEQAWEQRQEAVDAQDRALWEERCRVCRQREEATLRCEYEIHIEPAAAPPTTMWRGPP